MTWIIDNLGLIGSLSVEHVRQSILPIVLGFLLSVPLGWLAFRFRLGRGFSGLSGFSGFSGFNGFNDFDDFGSLGQDLGRRRFLRLQLDGVERFDRFGGCDVIRRGRGGVNDRRSRQRLAFLLLLAALGHGSVPDQCVDPRDEIALAWRLDDVVLGTLAHAPDAVGLEALGADDQDRDMAGIDVARQRAGGLEAVHAGQHHIHEHEIRLVAPAGGDAILRAPRRGHMMTVAFQQLGHHRRFGGRILDQQYACH